MTRAERELELVKRKLRKDLGKEPKRGPKIKDPVVYRAENFCRIKFRQRKLYSMYVFQQHCEDAHYFKELNDAIKWCDLCASYMG